MTYIDEVRKRLNPLGLGLTDVYLFGAKIDRSKLAVCRDRWTERVRMADVMTVLVWCGTGLIGLLWLVSDALRSGRR